MINKSLKILLGTNGLVLTAGAMIGPLVALFVEDVGGNLLDASLAGAIYALFAGFISFGSGKFADIIDREELIIAFGYILMGVGFLLFTIVNSIILLFYTQAIIGIGEAIYSPAFDKLFSKNVTIENSGKEWGTWESMNYFTQAFGATVGGIIAFNFGFNYLFILMSLFCFASGIYIATIKQ